MRNLKTARHVLILAFLLIASACATAPQSLGQSIFLAEGTLTGVYKSIDNAALAGTITKAQAIKARDEADKIDTAIEAAKAANVSGDTATAQSKYDAANALIIQLQAQLRTQGVKQ